MSVSLTRTQRDRGWVHRPDLAAVGALDVMCAHGHGIAVQTAGGWYAGNGIVGLLADVSAEPDMCEPRVGPFGSVAEAIEAYDEVRRVSRR